MLSDYLIPRTVSFVNMVGFLFNRTTTLQQWEEFTHYNWRRTEAEVGASQRLREAIFYTMRETENDLAAQGRAVDFALRRRSHEDEQALDELNWQRKRVFII